MHRDLSIKLSTALPFKNTGFLLTTTAPHLSFNELNQTIKEDLNHKKDLNETISDSSDNEDNEYLNESNSLESNERRSKDSKSIEQGRWNSTEHRLFLEGLILHGNEWKNIQDHIKTRSSTQARSHAQKFFLKLRKKINLNKNDEMINKKIIEIFQEEMKEIFRPKNLLAFVEKMRNLIFENCPKTPKEKRRKGMNICNNQFKLNELNNVRQRSQSQNNLNYASSLISLCCCNGEDNSTIISSTNKERKNDVFFITKEKRKVTIESPNVIGKSMTTDGKVILNDMKCNVNGNSYGNVNCNGNNCYENDMERDINKNYYDNASQTTDQLQQVNYVNITMIQNSIIQEKKQMPKAIKQDDPFNLEFPESHGYNEMLNQFKDYHIQEENDYGHVLHNQQDDENMNFNEKNDYEFSSFDFFN